MKKSLIGSWYSFVKLLRFLAWYAIAVATLFYFLPIMGLYVEGKYEAMSSVARFAAVLGLFAVIAAWQVIVIRDRRRSFFIRADDR